MLVVAKRLDTTWYGGKPLPSGLCVQWGPSYPQKKVTPTPTEFLAHIYCGKTAGWMKTPFDTEVDLGPGHIVLDAVPAPAKGAQQPPLFGPCLLWPRSPVSVIAELLLRQAESIRFMFFVLRLLCFA